VVSAIEETSMTMANAYYEHLHTWGERKPASRRPAIPPTLRLEDGSLRQVDPGGSSGTFAVQALVARFSNAAEFEQTLEISGAGSFERVFGDLFPTVDLQDASNEIDPPGTPPANMLQLPFAMGSTWSFGGPHSWNGNNTPPFSSMDFFTGGATCSSPPYLYAVSAAAGTTRRRRTTMLAEIDRGGWVTSYYHLRNLVPPASVTRNAALGTIACEICAGGYATGPHVHFSLKYNGAYVSLEGVELTGWTIHVGPEAYNTGSIERGGVSLNPWNSVLNDYHTYFGTGANTSLRFLPGDSGGLVRLPVDDPTNALAAPVDAKRRLHDRPWVRSWRECAHRSRVPTTTGTGNILLTGGADERAASDCGDVSSGTGPSSTSSPRQPISRIRMALDYRFTQPLGRPPDGAMWLDVTQAPGCRPAETLAIRTPLPLSSADTVVGTDKLSPAHRASMAGR
jgi:hypothetical protein